MTSLENHASATSFSYSTIGGYFLQDDPETVASTFDYVDFGLKSNVPGQEAGLSKWQALERQIQLLNEKRTPDIRYKLLFLGRHGQGIHNVAERKYGTAEWEAHWAKLDKLEGNGVVDDLHDAHLTNVGIQQAQDARDCWQRLIAAEKIPTPQSYYTSPLDRCCATAKITFSGLRLHPERPFLPTVKELLRETNGVHSCDRRSTKTYIQNTYPGYKIEPGFTENDELWDPKVRESESMIDSRFQKLLDDIFDHDQHHIISLTAHSGAIASILRVVRHRPFRLLTGAVIPVLVKADIKAGGPGVVEQEPNLPVTSSHMSK